MRRNDSFILKLAYLPIGLFAAMLVAMAIVSSIMLLPGYFCYQLGSKILTWLEEI